MRINILVLTIMAGLLVYTGSALACDTCGCSAKAGAAECACGMDAGDCTMCSASAGSDSNPDFNCACSKPIYDCAGCLKSESSKFAAHVGSEHPLPDGMTVLSRSISEFPVAYMATNMENIEATYGTLMASAGQQGLMGNSTRVYGIYHGDLYGAHDESTVYHAAMSVPADKQPASPLMSQTIPGGEYIVVVHRGPYEDLMNTYESFLSWAAEAGVPFDDRPSFEHYLSDPGNTPAEDLLTEIYLPVANPHGASHGDDHAGHGHA